MALRPPKPPLLMLVLLAMGRALHGPALTYTDMTSAYPADPDSYVRAVLGGWNGCPVKHRQTPWAPVRELPSRPTRTPSCRSYCWLSGSSCGA